MLLSLGLADIWYSQNVYCENVFLYVFKQRLIDNFLQGRNAFFEASSKCCLYKFMVDNHHIQYYLTKSLSPQSVKYITMYRLCSDRLNIESGRFRQVSRNERLCVYCENEVEDEFHFILKCPKYSILRRQYITPYDFYLCICF